MNMQHKIVNMRHKIMSRTQDYEQDTRLWASYKIVSRTQDCEHETQDCEPNFCFMFTISGPVLAISFLPFWWDETRLLNRVKSQWLLSLAGVSTSVQTLENPRRPENIGHRHYWYFLLNYGFYTVTQPIYVIQKVIEGTKQLELWSMHSIDYHFSASLLYLSTPLLTVHSRV